VHSVGRPVKGCHNISLCGLTTKLPDNITNNDSSSSTARPTRPTAVNSTPAADRDAVVDNSGNIALMLREENPLVAFDAQFHVFYIVDDGDVYLSRFDVDPFKDTGGTLRVTAKFRQYHHVSITFFL